MTKQTNTPKLRFPEFKNEWSKLTMNDFLMEDKQYGTQKDTNFPIVTSSRQGLYIQNKYFEGDRSFANENVTFSIVPINYFTYRHMSDDDIFKFNINKFNTPILVSKEYPVFTVKNTFSQNFIFYELNNNIRFLKFCRIQKKGGTRTRLYFKNLLKYQTYFPNYEEQQKIGDFFYLLDQQIELEQKKLELLEQQKQGYTQKIFSRKLRFKDKNGQIYPKWKLQKLKNILEFSNLKTTKEDEYPVLTSSRTGLLFQSDYYKDGKTFADSNIGYFILPKNYITYRSRSDDGKFKFNLNKIIDIGIISKYYPVFKGKGMDQYYLTLHLNYQLKKEYIKFATGTSQLVLSQKNLQEISTELPSFEEQTKIAGFLSKLDKLIEKQSAKVEILKQRKKGLLQKMFV